MTKKHNILILVGYFDSKTLKYTYLNNFDIIIKILRARSSHPVPGQRRISQKQNTNNMFGDTDIDFIYYVEVVKQFFGILESKYFTDLKIFDWVFH